MEEVLIVTNDYLLLRGLQAMLVEREGFRIEVKTDWQGGVQHALRHTPSLIITDFGPPEFDCADLTADLKSYEQTKDIPVLLINSHLDREAQEKCRNAGIRAILVRPFKPNELLDLVRRILSGKFDNASA